MKNFVLFLLISTCIHASDNVIPQIVLDAIRDAECLRCNGLYEPYFIRINLKKDVKKAKEHGFNLHGYILKCHNAKKCSDEVNKLLKLGIRNIDLGPYQVNYYYQHKRWEDGSDFSAYFEFDEAEERARVILTDLTRRYGYSWRTLGRYHHYDPKNKTRNRRYYSRLYKYIYGEKPKIWRDE